MNFLDTTFDKLQGRQMRCSSKASLSQLFEELSTWEVTSATIADIDAMKERGSKQTHLNFSYGAEQWDGVILLSSCAQKITNLIAFRHHVNGFELKLTRLLSSHSRDTKEEVLSQLDFVWDDSVYGASPMEQISFKEQFLDSRSQIQSFFKYHHLRGVPVSCFGICGGSLEELKVNLKQANEDHIYYWHNRVGFCRNDEGRKPQWTVFGRKGALFFEKEVGLIDSSTELRKTMTKACRIDQPFSLTSLLTGRDPKTENYLPLSPECSP